VLVVLDNDVCCSRPSFFRGRTSTSRELAWRSTPRNSRRRSTACRFQWLPSEFNHTSEQYDSSTLKTADITKHFNIIIFFLQSSTICISSDLIVVTEEVHTILYPKQFLNPVIDLAVRGSETFEGRSHGDSSLTAFLSVDRKRPNCENFVIIV